MNFSLQHIFKGDRVLWLILFLLSLASILIVYSATGRLAYREAGGFTAHYLIRHSVFIGAGFLVMVALVNYVPVKFYSLIAPLALLATFGLLAIALVQYKLTGKATPRSLDLRFISFQPAEFAKLALVMFGAKVLAARQKSKEDLAKAFKWVMGATVLVCLIIAFGNISTAGVIFAGMVGLMFVARVPLKFIGATGLVGLAFVVLMYFTADFLPASFGRVHTFKARIDTFMGGANGTAVAEDEGTSQADYAKLAIYEGGFIGKGPGGSDVSNYMEAAYNDFIYAIFIEEYGLAGGVIIVFLYLLFLFRGVTIVRKSSRTFPAFLATGIVLIYTIQAFVNMAVSTGVIPVTGQPLPWISMGGTSMLFTAAGFGIILSVSYHNKKEAEQGTVEEQVVVNIPDEDQELK
ncbi:MAG: FtsW/RodA/SpoVE family cell cycle protein [Mangrovibacterium sp.]